MPGKKTQFRIQIDSTAHDGFFPPRAALLNLPFLVNEATYAAVAATCYIASLLNRPQAAEAQMLTVSGGVAPPGIVGYNGKKLGALVGIAAAVLTIHRFVAYGAAERSPVVKMQQTYLVLS